MKIFIITGLTFCFLLLFNTSSFAVIASQNARIATVPITNDHNNISKTRKLSLREKLFTKILQKATEKSTNNKRGFLSLIIGGASLLLLLTPAAGIIFFASIAGLIFGILGLKRDQNKTMAIIGLIINGLMIILIIAAVATLFSSGLF